MVQCDDFGLFFAAIPIIKSKCFPWKSDKLKDKDVEKWLFELQQSSLIFLYEYSGKRYLKLSKWEQHQQVRANKSKFPTLDTEGIQLISIDINGNHLKTNAPVIENVIEISNRDTRMHLLGFAPHTKLTENQYSELITEYGESVTHKYAESLSDYIASKGLYNKYKDYKATIRNFIKKDNPNGIAKKEVSTDREAYLKAKAEMEQKHGSTTI